MVLVCYLDDSGKDPQNRTTTLAGYIARDAEWGAFENSVEPWFEKYAVDVLHAKDLKAGRGCFTGWTVLKKQAFISRVCLTRNSHVMMGLSMGAEKATYQDYRKPHSKRTVSPYSFCFNVIIDWVLRDIRIGRAVHNEGIDFVLEDGHENNREAADLFDKTRVNHRLENVLRSINFVPKSSCRAVQLADLLAFYSRRDNEQRLRAMSLGRETYASDTMARLIVEGLPHRGFVATGFSQNPGGLLSDLSA